MVNSRFSVSYVVAIDFTYVIYVFLSRQDVLNNIHIIGSFWCVCSWSLLNSVHSLFYCSLKITFITHTRFEFSAFVIRKVFYIVLSYEDHSLLAKLFILFFFKRREGCASARRNTLLALETTFEVIKASDRRADALYCF